MELAAGRSLSYFKSLKNDTLNNLLPAEEKLLEAVRHGAECKIGEYRPNDTPEQNRVRAEFVRFLALGGDEDAPVHEEEVRLTGAYIDGDLNCFGCDIQRRLVLKSCNIVGKLIFRNAFTRAISLEGSRVTGGIDGSRAKMWGSLHLGNGFSSARQVRLAGTEINGVLNCENGQFEWHKSDSGEKISLYCSRAHICGSVYLRMGFRAEQEVRFENALIDGNFDCTGGSFTGELWAINCIQAKIGGKIALNKAMSATEERAFIAKGKVSFRSAKIGGNLESIGGTIINRDRVALYFSMAKIKGSVFLSELFSAEGAVRFREAEIGGVLDFSNATFFNPRPDPEHLRHWQTLGMSDFDHRRIELSYGKAITFAATTVGGDVKFSGSFAVTGEVHFPGAIIHGTLDCSGANIHLAEFSAPDDKAINGVNARIFGDVFLKRSDRTPFRRFTARGEVCFNGATIQGNLDCEDGSFERNERDNGKPALSFTAANIFGGVILKKRTRNREGFKDEYGFESSGAISFHDADIGRNLDCSGGKFTNQGGRAIDGTGAKIGSNVYFSLGFESLGAVRMNRTQTGGEFICTGGVFRNQVLRLVPEGKKEQEEPRCENALKLRNAVIQNVLWLGGATPNDKLGDVHNSALWAPGKFNGSLDLRDARTAVLIDDQQIWHDWIIWNREKRRKADNLVCNILLEGFTYGRLGENSEHSFEERRHWLGCQPRRHLEEDLRPQPFHQLAKVLREMGHSSDARKIAIEEQDRVTAKNRGKPLQWIWRRFMRFSFRYGHHPERIVYAAAVVWLLCAGLFYRAEQMGVFTPIVSPFFLHDKVASCRPPEPKDGIVPRPMEGQPQDTAGLNWTGKSCDLASKAPEYPPFNALVFSSDVLLPFVNLRQEEFWQPIPKEASWGPEFWLPWIRTIMYFEKLFGWVAAIMLTSILGGIIKR